MLIICDIDGVLTTKKHFEPENCGNEIPNPDMRDFLAQAVMEAELVYLTGRDAKYRDATIKWLEENRYPNATLYMNDGYADDFSWEAYRKHKHKSAAHLISEALHAGKRVLYLEDDEVIGMSLWYKFSEAVQQNNLIIADPAKDSSLLHTKGVAI